MHFLKQESGVFALSKMLQLRSTLIFFFFLRHMKLESSVQFLFYSHLKELLCLCLLSLNVCSVSPMSCDSFTVNLGLKLYNNIQDFYDGSFFLTFNFCLYSRVEVILAHLIYFYYEPGRYYGLTIYEAFLRNVYLIGWRMFCWYLLKHKD